MADIIIFDMDGTLLDTALASIRAVQVCAASYGFPPLEADTIRRAIGWANPEFYHILYPDIEPGRLLPFAAEVEAYEGTLVLELGATIAFPGIEALLRALKARGKILYLASTGDPEHIDFCMRATGFARFFTDILCGEPDKTEMLARIVARHPGAESVMIGDTVKDAAAAHANGIECIGAGFGYCSPDRYPLFDRVAETPEELLEILCS